MKEEDKKEASTASEAEKPSNEASSASIKTEAMEAEDAGEKSKSEAEAKSKAEASTSAASDGKIKAEAKSVLPSGEAGDGDMDEAAMRRALQVRQFGISVWNSGKLKTLEFGKISSNW